MANPAPKLDLRTVVAVAIGGVIGALARVYLPWPALSYPGVPGDLLSTLIVNFIGAVLLGFVAGYATHRNWPDPLHKGITVGLLGSFTTMSALALAVNVISMGQPISGAAESLSALGLGLLCILVLVIYLGLTTLFTLASYRLGLRRTVR